ncbi:uncharacterized protein LOC131219386 [Magnolia sinica]|uniref:uncharacterized protein LOC131219386 n=1 Tax=Magnolia sinica TaxID=86752 RepID=UPI0026594E41|nr:uncharacterized protein LOC131219386 [Magnolia sinica]
MYGQGNYAPQFRHGPPATLPPPYQQGPLVPPPTYQQIPPAPPPPYHQGSPAPPPVYQQGPPAPPPPSFHHGPPAPPPLIHPGHPQQVQVPPPGMVNMGQPYLHPPPVHGSATVAPSYTTPQQNPQYPPSIGAQNVHHVNPPVPPTPVPPLTGPSPPPPRVLPPPVPSPGQMLYRTSPPMPPHGTMQGLQHLRPLPPPPPSGFVPITPAPFASFTQGDAHPPSMPPPMPPPPPSSPPPLPPSPPPPSSPPPNNLAVGVSEASSLISSNPALDMSRHSGSDFGSDKVSDSAEMTVDNEVGPTQVKDDASIPGGCTHSEVDTSCEVDSVMVNGVTPKGQALVDLPLPPPKPVDEEVVRNIEVLCQFIAKVGPEFENLARTKEAGNPKFAFLFGGEPGSAAAVGHEYFRWMKKKCHLEFKVRNESEQSDPAPRPSEIESSLQSISSIDDGLSVSPAVSDMDVEDDVNQPDKDEGICQSIDDSKGEPASVCNEALLLKGQLLATQSSTKPLMQEDVSGTLSGSGSSPLLLGQGKEDDQSTFARPHTEDLSLVRSSSKAIECTLDSNMQASNKRLIAYSSPVKVSPPTGGGYSEEIPRVIVKDGSPFKLIQDYASDDSADDDKGTCLEDVSPVRVSPPVTQDISCVNEDKRNDMDSDLDVKNVSTTEIGFSIATGLTEAAQNSDSSVLLNKVASPTVIVRDLLDSGEKTDELSIHKDKCQASIGGTESLEVLNHNDALPGNDFDFDVQPEKFHQEVDAKRASTALNVDEFGRLVREGGSDSDSDGMHYAGRRSKRGRSWSRSRSPQEGRWRRRSRSPWRRRDKRSRSRSRSPKKHRSRSKSPPAFRRMGEFGNEKLRRDNRSQPECFNFLRGRCYRGASCRFLHRDSAVGDARRWNRGKQEPHQEFQQNTRDPTLHGDAHYAVEAHEAKNSMGVELSADKHDFSHEEGKSLDVQNGPDMLLNSVEATKDGDLDEKKGQDSLKDDTQPAISNEFGQTQVTITSGELSHSQGSKEVLDQIQEPQETQQVQEGPSIQPPDKEGSQQPVESQDIQPLPADSFPTGPEPVAETHHSPGDVIGETSVPQPPQANISDSLSVPELQNVSTHPPHVEGSSTSHPLPVQTFPPSSFSNQPPQSQPYPSQVPVAPLYPDQMPMGQPYSNQVPGSQPYPSESFRPPPFPQPPTFSGGDFRFPPSQLPPPPQLHPSPPFPQDTLNALHASHPPREHHLQPPGVNFQSQPLPVERYPSHRPPFVDYHSQHAPPPNHSWASLPPPPFANESAPGPAIPNSDFRPLQFQQNPMLPRNNEPQPLLRPFPTDTPPQYRTFPSMEDPRQPAVDNLRDHSFGGSNFMREHRFMHPTMPEGQFNTGRPQDYHSHPLPPLREEYPGPLSVRENVGSFQPLQDPRFTSSSALTQTIHSQPPPFPREPSQVHSYGSQIPTSGGFSSHMGVPGNVDSSLSRYPSSFPVGNQPSRLSDGAGLKTSTSTHYNPFASTFEQTPASLKSNSSISRREIDSNYSTKYDSPFSLSHGPVSVQGSGGPGARHLSSPPDSGRFGGQFLPKSGRELVAGDQYDPLFDSIEPSTNVFKKFDHVHGRESTFEPISGSVAGRANETLRLSSLHGPLDVEEKRKDGVATHVKPPENDEFDGAAIDAEVGTVENVSPQPGEGKNWSPANPIDLMNTAVGEIEIDQVQSPSKSKKSKDSRSMKLFKIAIADFVKEVLKPSWRQGNMSKEVFKTIVKKTVDKVSGAMQSHQIPKSQAKINQYVESSQRKLTKLVMGYVDKYTKI